MTEVNEVIGVNEVYEDSERSQRTNELRNELCNELLLGERKHELRGERTNDGTLELWNERTSE